MAFVDSNFWIGLLHIDDRHSKRAFELVPQIRDSKEKIYVTSGVVHEVTNHLFKIKGKQAAVSALNFFLFEQNLEIIFLTENLWKNEIELFVNYEMNLTDAQIVAAMQEKSDNTIYSFDAHFDQIKGIKRIY